MTMPPGDETRSLRITPAISTSGISDALSAYAGQLTRTVLPTGSFQRATSASRAARAWLITITRAVPATSRLVMPRPESMGIPSVRK